LAQLTKSFAIYLYGLFGCYLVVLGLSKYGGAGWVRLRARAIAAYVGLAAVSFLAVISVGFCFDRMFTPLSKYTFRSTSFQRLQSTPGLRSIPLPVPYAFLQGLDMMKDHEQKGNSSGNVYLLGELGYVRDPTFHGFKSYYVVALFFKEAIPLQVLFALGILWTWKNRGLYEFLLGEGLLFGTIAILLVWLSFFNRTQIGVRHVLPFFAIDTIVAGAAFVGFSTASRARKSLLVALLLWLAVSMASYYPHMIPYMNEWVIDRRLAYLKLADSNLDWGQDWNIVCQFLKNNPDVISSPRIPVAGRILVGVNQFVGIGALKNEPDSLLWLRSRYKPVAQIGYGHLLFDVPASDFSTDAIRK
jgi:hypothetical protein